MKIKIMSEHGLHARPASMLVSEAMKFQSAIYLIKNDERYNAKSIMSVMASAVEKDDVIEIVAEGDDADLAVQTLGILIKEMP